MINYIIQVIFFQVLFLAVYDLFLKKETFFKWNRVYLLATPILSFIIPLMKFESLKKSIPQDYFVLLPEVMMNPQVIIEQTANRVETINYLNIFFYIGIGILSTLFLIKLVKIIRLILSNNVVKKENYSLILLEKKQSAFSFFNYIFIHNALKENENLNIIEHELVHCKQYHTLDLLFFEMLKILMWFNPMIYIYQKRITLLHEYISDAEVVKETDKNTYFNNLLATTFNVENISFVNQFYKHSLIKKRIIMITKEKSQKMKQLKYLVLVPLLASMLFYTSCTDEVQNIENISKELVNNKAVTDGKYFRAEDGKVLFMGKSLNGTVVQFEDYTVEEKEMFNKMMGTHDYAQRNLQIIINELGERVIFMKPPTESDYSSNGEYKNSEDVPFAYIDKAPQFQDCIGDNKALKDCLNKGFQVHVRKNFNATLGKGLGLSGKQKIYVQFKITKEGTIEILGARAPHKDLEVEARRVVNSLPKMIPGEHNGKKVNVTYMLPISFNVE